MRQFHYGNQFKIPNSGDIPLRQDSKICLTVDLVVMTYVLSIQHGPKTKLKKKIYKINRFGWQFLISGKGF